VVFQRSEPTTPASMAGRKFETGTPTTVDHAETGRLGRGGRPQPAPQTGFMPTDLIEIDDHCGLNGGIELSKHLTYARRDVAETDRAIVHIRKEVLMTRYLRWRVP
jgi:hypothetical protein